MKATFTATTGRFSVDIGDLPEDLEVAADKLETSSIPIGVHALSILCATLARRLAKLERNGAPCPVCEAKRAAA